MFERGVKTFNLEHKKMNVTLATHRDIAKEKILDLYRANEWSAAEKPAALYQALLNSDHLVTAWEEERLVGLGNAISDGHLVVYYPHLLVHPNCQGQGVGQKIMDKMQERYGAFHMQILVADGRAIDFYKKVGFTKAGDTAPMWIYKGTEH